MRFSLTPGSPEPIYAQIVRQVRTGVASGSIARDERLPSVRELASLLLVNPNTVQKAYAELARDGIVDGKHGSGTFVAEGGPSRRSRREAKARFDSLVGSLLTEAVHAGLTGDGVVDEIERRAAGFAFPDEKG